MTIPYVAWRDCYSVGDDSLDADHKKIIRIVNDLYAAMQGERDDAQMESLLDRLVEYTTSHFEHEERVLRALGHPELAAHKARHDRMREQTAELRRHFGTVTGQDLLCFLKEWWVNHIQQCDKQYASYLGAAAR